MKAITLHQPWASLVAIGAKTIETRSWSTRHRGPLAIHAGATMTRAQRATAYADPIGGALNGAGIMLGGDCEALPRGAIIAACELVDVVPMVAAGPTTVELAERHRATGMLVVDGSGRDPRMAYYRPAIDLNEMSVDVTDQRPFGDFAPGRFAWLLEDVQPCEPVPARGHQQLWNWSP
jgi:hypothetical protein